jgi:hypothetical protein
LFHSIAQILMIRLASVASPLGNPQVPELMTIVP